MSGAWMQDASCRGLPLTEANKVFFPLNPEDPTAWETGKALCSTCPVIRECLTAVEAHRSPIGLYAGLTPDERLELGIVPVNRNNVGRRHGTYSKWSDGCRCDECVEAKRTYAREQMRQWRRGNTSDPSSSLVRLPLYEKDAS